jgi:transposase InsO family protein
LYTTRIEAVPVGPVHRTARRGRRVGIWWEQRRSYDNALAETVIGLYKAELVDRHGPWPSPDDLELATLEYIDWYNHRRLHSACGYRPPAEHEATYYDQHTTPAAPAGVQ